MHRSLSTEARQLCCLTMQFESLAGLQALSITRTRPPAHATIAVRQADRKQYHLPSPSSLTLGSSNIGPPLLTCSSIM